LAAYNVTVEVRIKTYDVNYVLLSNSVKAFVVRHAPYDNPAYKDQDYIIFNNQTPGNTVYKIESKVETITIQNGSGPAASVLVLPDNLLIESTIDYLRYFAFSSNGFVPNVVPADQDGDGFNDVFKIGWSASADATHYELEYTTVNNYDISNINVLKSANSLNFDYKNNSTRVATFSNSYTVPIIFDRGYFICRVRPVGRATSGPNIGVAPVYGGWSSADSGPLSNLVSFTQGIGWYFTPHFESKKNWQYNATFAEEAKRKDVINFADGSLRSRQTITRMNSDNTTIVGENVYDFTGRAAVNILPSPYMTLGNPTGIPSFLYKDNNNLSDATGNKYSKNDFDLDDPIPANACFPVVVGLKNTSGSSKYYSPNNPDMNAQQGFVPDAQKFPFNQVEFTPDNTGRIRKQGGVGMDHQLGTGRETKYFYGTPEQVELDRLFGSEVGYASHYQKNMVVDANGQVSITYLDMEGRTIATSLAGSAPPNMLNMPKQPATATNLQVDMFNKDAQGNSESNLVNAAADAITFNKSILVTDNTPVTFNYAMSIDKFTEPCLKAGVCFNCVYDYEMKLVDDCGQQIFPIPGGGSKMLGRFNVVGNDTVFTTSCYNPSLYQYTETQPQTPPLTLVPGVYYLNKTLKINKAARDFYLKKYLDPNYNGCIKSLSYFDSLAVAQMDTTGCNVKCENCFKKLGTKDDFVSLGKGTEEEWDAAYEECKTLCGYPKSTCEIALAQLLADVSPNGQYGEVNNLADPLSVFNAANLLPENIKTIAPLYPPTLPNTPPNNLTNNIFNGPVVAVSPPVAFWKNPKHYKTNQAVYLDKKGKRYRVMLTLIPNTTNQFNLPVTNAQIITNPNSSAMGVFQTNTVGVFYTWPENLANLNDFISIWQPSFAKSLVKYHPEFCYYKDCEDLYGAKQPGDTISSNDYDSKLLFTSTFQEALTKQLVVFDASLGYYKFNLGHDPVNTNAILSPALAPNALVLKYGQYYTISSGQLSISEFVSYTFKCGTQFANNQTTNLNCIGFGNPINASSAQITDMKNKEWNAAKSIYYGEKQKMLYQVSNYKRLHSAQCNYYNACIGNPDFDGYNSPMIKYISPTNVDYTSAYFNSKQPCNQIIKDLYAGKEKRFGYENNNEPDPDEAAYQMYLQTGKCPNALDLQNLMAELAQTNKLTAASEPLQNHPALTVNLYNYINNATPPPFPYTAYSWEASVIAGNVLNMNVKKIIANQVVKFVQLNPPSVGFNWSNVKDITQFMHTGFSGNNSTFSCTAKVVVASVVSYVTVTGLTDIKLDGCMFKDVCKPNDLAKQLQSLMNTLKAQNKLFHPLEPLGLSGANTMFGPYLTKANQLVGQSPTSGIFLWAWDATSVATFYLYDQTNPSCKIKIRLMTLNNQPITTAMMNQIISFSKIKSDYQNYFTMQAYNQSGGLIGTVKGEIHKVCNNVATPLSMGTCDKPDPASCKTPYHQNRKELEALLKDILENAKYLPVASAPVANVMNNLNLTTNLIGNFQPLASNLPSTRYFVNSNFYRNLAGAFTSASTIPNDSLTFDLKSPCINSNPNPNSQNALAFTATEEENDPCVETEYCKVWLKTNNKSVSTAHGLANIISVKKLIGCGPASNNNFTDFYLLVEYSTNIQQANVFDTIFGSSCYEIQNCNPCKDELNNCPECGPSSSQADEFSQSAFLLDSMAVVDGKAKPDSTLALYTTYTTNISNLNSAMGWTANDTSYIQPQSLLELLSSGYANVFDQYNYFINDFDSTIDERSYLKSVAKFAKDYGPAKNLQRSYGRYKKATQKYNQKAISLSTPSLNPMVDTTFYFGRYLDSIDVYIDYLVAQAATTQAQTAKDFFDGRVGFPPPPDQGCLDLWNQYIIAYNQFYSNPANVVNCPPPASGPFNPQEFADRNYCCAPNYSNFINFINQFYSSNTCPQTFLAGKPPCDNPDPPNPDDCASLYATYVSQINQYNLSAWAVAHNAFLSPTLFSNPSSFFSQGYCNCVSAYMNYIQQFINAGANDPLTAPVSIKNWQGCGPGSPSTCDETFDQYLAALDQFANWANSQINGFQYLQLMVSYDITSFTNNGLCYCAPGFIAFLNSVVNGNITDPAYIKSHLSIQGFCNQVSVTCPNPNAMDTIVSPPVPTSENPCVKYAKDLAKANAANAYKQYVDAQTSIFITKYNNYCLGATESLTRDYSSREFHYTLYYYDQAGNLIKTIPPEGLDVAHYLSITSYQSPNSIKIKNDRAYKTKTVFVSHGMPTTYEYNSLNQLIKQKMPDHDGMGAMKFRYDYGLDTALTIVSSNFPEANKGYAVASETIGPNAFMGTYVRGKVFESEDGSMTWKQSNGISGTNIKKIQYIAVGGTNYGFAVGSDGAFMFTIDGSNWDYYPVHEFTNGNSTLNDLHFIKKAGNMFEGLLVGDKGVIIKVKFNNGNITVDGSIRTNAVTSAVFINPDENITDITADNGTPNPFYYITVLDKTTNTSKVYRSNGNTGSSGYWQLQTTRLTDLAKVVHVKNSQYYFAAGADGNLLRSKDGGATWVMRETNTAMNFKDIYFANHRKGVAILETGGIGSLYKTMDGGNNWTLMVQGTSTKYFKSLSRYKDLGSATIDKVTASGTGGLVKRITINQTDTANVFIGAVTTDIASGMDVNDISVIPYDVTSNSYKLFAVAVGNGGQAAYCLDYLQNNPTWSAITLNASLNYKKVLMNLQSPNTNPIADGLIMDQNGVLHSFSSSTDIDASNVVFSELPNIVSSPNSFKDITFDWDNASPYNTAYLLAKTSSNVRFGDLAMSNLNVGNPVPNIYTDGAPVQNEVLSLSAAGNDRVAVGSTGGPTNPTSIASIVTGAVATNNIIVTDKSNLVNPVVINDIKFDAVSGNIVAAGNDGYFAEKSGSSPFIVKSSKTSRDINAFNYAYTVGTNRVYYVVTAQGETGNIFSDPATNLMNLNLYPSGASQLNDIAVPITTNLNPPFYAVGDNGALFFGLNDFTPVTPVVNGEDNLNTVAYFPNTPYVIAGGDNTRSYFVSGTSSTLQKSWYTNEITKIHFTDADNGYFVGKRGLIRHTADGGQTWKTVKSPMINSSNDPVDLHAVYTTGANTAIIAGKNDYVANVSDLTVNAAINGGPTSPLNQVWQDIDLYDLQNGFIVGSNFGPSVKVGQLLLSNGVLTAVNPVPAMNGQPGGFKAVYAFKGTQTQKFIAVGENRTLKIWNGTAYATINYQGVSTLNSILNPGDNIYDIAATDNGNFYFVSDRSRFVNFGITDPSLSAIPIALTPINHYIQNLSSSANSYVINSSIRTISMIDGTNGFLGGEIFNGPNSFLGKLGVTFGHDRGFVSTFFWYDRLGRLVLSQNTKQSKKPGKAYSYTLYDALGRITEVGEKQDNGGSPAFTSIFGTYVGVYFNSNAIDDAKFNAWILGIGARTEVTHTYYDQAVFTTANAGLPASFAQDNLRKRVASVVYEDSWDNNIFTYNHATHYSYDVHGNVKTLLQDNKALATFSAAVAGQQFKRIDYDYDLISGKVNQVSYQAGDIDAFYHRYEYDDDNRITEVKTSRNGLVWETDAKYFYYKHGPLARTEYGHDKVQGMDYAYTLHGWIKGVNSDKLAADNDIGKDGKPLTPNKLFAHDAMGYSLQYYNGDFAPIDATQWTSANRFEANKSGSSLLASTNNLYNGNIGIMNTSIVQPLYLNGPLAQNYLMTQLPAANAYKYDQLNRIAIAKNFSNLDLPSNTWLPTAGTDSYRNEFEYDDNGNITKQKKYSANASAPMDNIDYYYDHSGSAAGKLKQNRLYGIKDNAASVANIDDIETATTNPNQFDYANINNASANSDYNCYRYDEIGNLVYDRFEQINVINWTIEGKIKEVNRLSTSAKKNLKFDYDAMGNRIAKHIYAGSTWESSTYYVRDAQGNVMATYKSEIVCLSGCQSASPTYGMSYKVIERDIYGSSRCAIDQHTVEMLGFPPSNQSYERIVGNKTFELSNHLGNVISVVSDRKIPIEDASNVGFTKHYIPQVLSSTDYYAFGEQMNGRTMNNGYRYGFNGMENDNEVKGAGNSVDFGERIYDPRLGKWLSLDRFAAKYPGLSAYAYTFNNPVIFKDIGGADGSLSVVKDSKGGGEITLETTIHCYGKDAKGMIKDLNNKAAALSAPRYFKDESGGVWKVNLKIKYVEGYALEVAEKKHSVPLQANHLDWMEVIATGVKPGDNILKIDKDVDLGANGHSGVGASGGVLGKGSSIKTGLHEPGHMVGLGDRYIDFKGVPYDDPAFKGDPMVSGDQPVTEWNLIHFYDIFKEGMNAIKESGGKDVLNKIISKSISTYVPLDEKGSYNTQLLYNEAKSKQSEAPKMDDKKTETDNSKPKK
jgi:RHS repeat-associated protein